MTYQCQFEFQHRPAQHVALVLSLRPQLVKPLALGVLVVKQLREAMKVVPIQISLKEPLLFRDLALEKFLK